MKKLVMAVSGITVALLLTACGDVGNVASGGSAAPAGTVADTSSSAPAASAETSAEDAKPTTPSETPKSSEKPKPKPTAATPDKPKPKPKAPAGVPCAISSGACIDLSANKSWIIRDGAIAYGPVPITSGKKGHATPIGTFSVSSKVKNYHSRQFDAPMPNSVFFIPGIAFHTGSLSQPSHGCIHLSPAASAKYFSTLKIGDTVQVVR